MKIKYNKLKEKKKDHLREIDKKTSEKMKLSHNLASALYGEEITNNLEIQDNSFFDKLAPHGEKIIKDEF